MSSQGEKAERPSPPKSPPFLPPGCEALLGKKQLCFAIGVSLRTFISMVSAGQFPKPDTYVGKLPKWRVQTLNGWIEFRCSKSRPKG